MKLLIYWYSDGDLRTRKFLRREVIEAPGNPEKFVISHMTEGAIWRHLWTLRVSEEDFEKQLRKQPDNPPEYRTAT